MRSFEVRIRNNVKRSLIFFWVVLLPMPCFAALINNDNFHYYAQTIAYANFALEITSAICIKEFFFLGGRNRTNFQVFNLFFGIVFYIVALFFLINEKSFYVGFAQLSDLQCISKFFFDLGIYSWLQWLVVFAIVINVIYIWRYHDA